MMLKLATLSILALGLPVTFAQTESTAIRFKSYHDQLSCKMNAGDRHYMADGGCYDLPKSRMDVTSITETCRVFIYKNNDCTGEEKQVFDGQMCINIESYHTIKAFCH